jgi:hypothetical protein
MASTGEVASFGKDVYEAYWASLISTTGFKVPRAGSGVLIGGDITKPEMAIVAKELSHLGFKLYCSSPVVEEYLNSLPYITVKKIFFPKQDKRKLRMVFDDYDIQCVFNLAKSRGASAVDEDYVARRYVSLRSLEFLVSDTHLQKCRRLRSSLTQQCSMCRTVCQSIGAKNPSRWTPTVLGRQDSFGGPLMERVRWI